MKPRKTDKKRDSGGQSSPLRLKSKKGVLLARWTDGLFYFVKILKVSASNKTCTVEFEDKSVANVHFKDLLEEKEEGLTVCHACGQQEEEDSNLLVKCANCDRDYHHACHVPPLAQENEEDDTFTCRVCVFTSCAQAGGAKKSGQLALKYAEMKQYFPYDMQHLTWNATHTSNVEQCYCYCGGPGIWYNKMLQCCRCHQWFHEACLQCLDEELLIGDRFFIFACAHCNYGVEFLQRMDLSWFDITHISMFHLIMTLGKRYVDLESDIVPFIVNRGQTFGLQKLLNGLHSNFAAASREISKVLQNHGSVFCWGAEVKKRCTFYGIRERVPPCPPVVSIPSADEVITTETMAYLKGKTVVFTPSKFTLQVPYVLRGGNKVVPPTMGAKIRESKLAKIARVKSEHNYCTPVKCLEDSLSSQLPKLEERWELFDANNNSPSTHLQPLWETNQGNPSDTSSSSNTTLALTSLNSFHSEPKETVFCDQKKPAPSEPDKKEHFWSLDTAFPEPANFQGANHPFLTEFEQENLRKQRSHFENQLEILSSLLLEDGGSSKASCPLLSPLGGQVTAIKNIKGFKGELADLINSTYVPPFNRSPKKFKRSPAPLTELTLKEQRRFERLRPKNKVSAWMDSLPSKIDRDCKPLSNVTPCCINGVKISPKVEKVPRKNGMIYVKPESQDPLDVFPEVGLDKASQKKLQALNRCLKKLTPTCGFRFPVLEESHPAVVNNVIGPVISSVPEKKTGGGGGGSCPPSSQTQSLSLGLAASQTIASPQLHSKHVQKDRKRKRETVVHKKKDKSIKDHRSMSFDVRRSHRSRSTVQRFEAAAAHDKPYGLMGKMSASGGLVEAEQYDVVSLRIRPENGLVEYLINWSQ